MTPLPRSPVCQPPLLTSTTGWRPADYDWRHPRHRHQTAAGQDRHQKCPTAVHCRNSRGISAPPRRHYWQPTVNGRARCRSLAQWLLSAAATPSVTRSLSPAAAETVVHPFIVNRLDYCNSILYGVADGLIRRLQSVQNAVAPLATGVRRRDHVTPTLRQLHWLPVPQRVLFKIAVLAFHCLAVQAPSYLADDCQLVSDPRPRRLHSSHSLTCAVRRTRNTYGDRCFAAAGPRVWNSLPAELRQCNTHFSNNSNGV